MGLCEGVTFPAVTSMMARWAPASERSRMTFLVMAGGQVFFYGKKIGILVMTGGWRTGIHVIARGESFLLWQDDRYSCCGKKAVG